jgi:hypothetical protein
VSRLYGLSVLTLLVLLVPLTVLAQDQGEIRLYALDCGGGSFKDLAAASDTGEMDGQSGRLADPCSVSWSA